MIRITIVTITYNAARSLQRTLDSVRSQTYPHIEHLIIDGASKDDTVRIAEQYKATSPHQVIIQSEPDKGLYDAMNKGLQKASGDYIVFLNAGDSLYAEDTIEKVVSAASLQSSAFSPQPSAFRHLKASCCRLWRYGYYRQRGPFPAPASPSSS